MNSAGCGRADVESEHRQGRHRYRMYGNNGRVCVMSARMYLKWP